VYNKFHIFEEIKMNDVPFSVASQPGAYVLPPRRSLSSPLLFLSLYPFLEKEVNFEKKFFSLLWYSINTTFSQLLFVYLWYSISIQVPFGLLGFLDFGRRSSAFGLIQKSGIQILETLESIQKTRAKIVSTKFLYPR
jgi:hypothetical protein